MSAMARLTNLLTRNDNKLVLGDFNLHHPMWGGPETVTDNAADDLIDDMEERRFGLWLPPGTITRRAADIHTMIDLVWGSYELSRRLVACNVDETIHADSDHLPIRMIIDVKTPLPRPPRRRN
jgi:endonuclease/exonuclease/phosphatase family metal-dependent hydrolase